MFVLQTPAAPRVPCRCEDSLEYKMTRTVKETLKTTRAWKQEKIGTNMIILPLLLTAVDVRLPVMFILHVIYVGLVGSPKKILKSPRGLGACRQKVWKI